MVAGLIERCAFDYGFLKFRKRFSIQLNPIKVETKGMRKFLFPSRSYNSRRRCAASKEERAGKKFYDVSENYKIMNSSELNDLIFIHKPSTTFELPSSLFCSWKSRSHSQRRKSTE